MANFEAFPQSIKVSTNLFFSDECINDTIAVEGAINCPPYLIANVLHPQIFLTACILSKHRKCVRREETVDIVLEFKYNIKLKSIKVFL